MSQARDPPAGPLRSPLVGEGPVGGGSIHQLALMFRRPSVAGSLEAKHLEIVVESFPGYTPDEGAWG